MATPVSGRQYLDPLQEMFRHAHQEWRESQNHRSHFEDFITHARTDRYSLIYSLVAQDKTKPGYEDN